MTDLEILKGARAKITDPKSWTQGSFAQTQDDVVCKPLGVEAVKWCAIGAICALARDYGRSLDRVSTLLEVHTLGWPLDEFNDSRTHAEVLAVFDAAIAKLEKK